MSKLYVSLIIKKIIIIILTQYIGSFKTVIFVVVFSRNSRAFHSLKTFKCPDCGLTFPRSDKLRLHMLKHSNHREFMCETCGKQFKRKVGLVKYTYVVCHTWIREKGNGRTLGFTAEQAAARKVAKYSRIAIAFYFIHFQHL